MSDVISQLIEITGLTRNVAEDLLRLNDNNLELAINYHLENGVPNEAAVESVERRNDNNSDNNSLQSDTSRPPLISDGRANVIFSSDRLFDQHMSRVRAPIPIKREQLLQPDEDQFRLFEGPTFNHSLPVLQYDSRRKRRIPFTVCPFRDFSREAEIQEEEIIGITASTAKSSTENIDLAEPSGNIDNNTLEINLPLKNSTTTNLNSTNNGGKIIRKYTNCNLNKSAALGSIGKKRRLDDLFRPPTDLLFWGTFQAARDFAKSQNSWMLVNLQDQSEFQSQILNRDIWPDSKIRKLVKAYFILWQVSIENREGIRFKIFYHCQNVPYVCIIDPRTGEEKLKCKTNSLQEFYGELTEFLNENSYKLDNLGPERKRRFTTSTKTSNSINTTSTSTVTNSPPSTYTSSTYIPKYEKSELELSEQDQIDLAIMKSLNETNVDSINTITKRPEDDKTINIDENFFSYSTDNSSDFSGISEDNEPDNENSTKNIFNQSSNKSTNENTNNEKSEVENPKNKPDLIEKSKLCSSYLDYLGSRHDPLTQIQIRISDQQRETLKWPASTRIAALKLFIVEKVMSSKLGISSELFSSESLTVDSLKLIRSYPRQNIFELNQNLTLIEANLHPSSILYLHLDE